MGQAPWLVLMLMVWLVLREFNCPETMPVSVWLLYIRHPYDYVHPWRHFLLPVCPTVASSEVFLAPTPHSNSYCIFSKHSSWIWNTLLNLCFIVAVMKLLFDFYLRCLSHSPGNPFCMSKPHVPIWHPIFKNKYTGSLVTF